jgi:hypothetical protein
MPARLSVLFLTVKTRPDLFSPFGDFSRLLTGEFWKEEGVALSAVWQLSEQFFTFLLILIIVFF